jgi:hypothetical protein
VVNESDHPAAKKLVAALEAEKAFRIVTQFVNPTIPHARSAKTMSDR